MLKLPRHGNLGLDLALLLAVNLTGDAVCFPLAPGYIYYIAQPLGPA